MPLKLSVGLTKKIGLPDYGSLGASCHIEVELDAATLRNDLDGFHQQVRRAYIACRQAIDEELARSGADTAEPVQPASIASRGRCARAPGTNGHGGALGSATEKQLRYVRQLADQLNGLGVRRLDELAQRMFSKPMSALAGLEVSALIDMLKAVKDGHVSIEDVFSGGVAP